MVVGDLILLAVGIHLQPLTAEFWILLSVGMLLLARRRWDPWQRTLAAPHSDWLEWIPDSVRRMGHGVGKPLLVKVISHLVLNHVVIM